MVWLTIDKDGTENIFNEHPFRGDKYPQICKKHGINHHNSDKFKDKWYNTFTDGYFQVPKNTGV